MKKSDPGFRQKGSSAAAEEAFGELETTDSVFSSDDSIFGDDEGAEDFDDDADQSDVVYMDADNAEEMLGRFAKPYRFAREKGRPPEGFHVRMATMAALEKWQRFGSKKRPDDPELFRAVCELIADAVVSKSGEPVWTDQQIKAIAVANAPRFMRMQACVMDRNDLKKLQQLVPAAAKN